MFDIFLAAFGLLHCGPVTWRKLLYISCLISMSPVWTCSRVRSFVECSFGHHINIKINTASFAQFECFYFKTLIISLMAHQLINLQAEPLSKADSLQPSTSYIPQLSRNPLYRWSQGRPLDGEQYSFEKRYFRSCPLWRVSGYRKSTRELQKWPQQNSLIQVILS